MPFLDFSGSINLDWIKSVKIQDLPILILTPFEEIEDISGEWPMGPYVSQAVYRPTTMLYKVIAQIIVLRAWVLTHVLTA